MKRILLLSILCALFGAAPAATKDAPSRAADKGCKWEKIDDKALGLALWVERCDYGFRKINLYAKQNTLMQHYSDGGEDETLIEVFDLKEGETPEAGVKRVFAEHTPDKDLVARCLLKPYDDDPVPPGRKRYTFKPNAALQKELDKQTDPGDIPEPPCGDWGYAPDGIQYFETQPASGARRILFVRVGQDEPLYDENTLRLLPPNP